MSKYGNRKTEINGMVFDSKHEAERWIELKYMERVCLIHDLKRQVPYELIPSQKDENGKVVERPVRYVADFVYYDTTKGCTVVEDAKGLRTDVYKLKRKLMRWVHNIEIQEV